MTLIDLDTLASAAEAAKRFGDASLGGVDDDTADALIALARAVVRWREARAHYEATRAAVHPAMWARSYKFRDALLDASVAESDLLRLAAQFTTKGDTGR